jgi:hypothetical protein
MNRITPGEIKFEQTADGNLHYAEAVHIKNHDTRDQARQTVEGGLAVLWENVRTHPNMELAGTVIEEDSDLFAAKIIPLVERAKTNNVDNG